MPNICRGLLYMLERLLSPEDLIRITGAKRYSKQCRWFRDQFGIDVLRNARGEIVMLWSTLDALVLNKWSITRAQAAPAEVELFYD